MNMEGRGYRKRDERRVCQKDVALSMVPERRSGQMGSEECGPESRVGLGGKHTRILEHLKGRGYVQWVEESEGKERGRGANGARDFALHTAPTHLHNTDHSGLKPRNARSHCCTSCVVSAAVFTD